jgi:hypothetical protein
MLSADLVVAMVELVIIDELEIKVHCTPTSDGCEIVVVT